jgi:hypothetical protein
LIGPTGNVLITDSTSKQYCSLDFVGDTAAETKTCLNTAGAAGLAVFTATYSGDAIYASVTAQSVSVTISATTQPVDTTSAVADTTTATYVKILQTCHTYSSLAHFFPFISDPRLIFLFIFIRNHHSRFSRNSIPFPI